MGPSSVGLAISTLGPLRIELDGQAVTGFRTVKVQALLVYLVVEGQRSWPRSILADLLWPDLPEKNAQSNLRNAISNLRRVIGDRDRARPFLLVSRDSLHIDPACSVWLDARAFTELVESAGSVDVQRLERAVSLYHGDFMQGFPPASPLFENWITQKAEHFRQEMAAARRLLVCAYQRAGQLDQAIHHAREWLGMMPWDETAHRHLMELLALSGQRSASLAQYEVCRQQLDKELGVQPEPATIELYQRIRRGEYGPHQVSRSPTAISGDIGEQTIRKAFTKDQSKRPAFFARTDELARMDQGLDKALRGEGQVLLVIGDPGSGKTTLLTEFSCQAVNKHAGLIVAQGQCNAYTGEADPYFPFLEIAQILISAEGARPAGKVISAELSSRLWNLFPMIIRIILEEGPDLINSFFAGRDLLSAANAHPAVDASLLARIKALVESREQKAGLPKIRQAILFNQLTNVLTNLSEHNPLILILDDLQWIDANSVNLLFHLCRRLASSRILILGAYRPEDVAMGRGGERHPLEGVINELQANLGDIHIDLMQGEGMDFIQALVDSEPNQLDDDFRRMLHRHTGGHPLFTIELLRGMQLRGDLRRNEYGQWIAGGRLDWNRLPVRVEAVIAERIGHLPEDQQALLQAACVEGEQFTAEILAEILNRDTEWVIQTLSQEVGRRHRLVDAQGRKQIAGRTLSIYRFRHFLYQTYLYQWLDEVERARLHEEIGSVLEKYYIPELESYPEISHQLAWHFDQAGHGQKAVHYYALAGKSAAQLSAYREAVIHYKRALHIQYSLPEGDEKNRRALQLHLSLGPALTAIQGWASPELETNYQRVKELCDRMGDDTLLVPALWLLAVYRLGRSEHSSVVALSNRLSALAEKIGSPALLSLARLQVSSLYMGKLAEAREILIRASQSLDVDLQRSLAQQFGMSPSVTGLAYLGNCLWLMGYLDQAEMRLQQACDLAEAVGFPMTLGYALGRRCWQNAIECNATNLKEYAEKLLQIARLHELRNFELAATFYLSWIDARRGNQPDEAVGNMDRAMQDYQSLGNLLNRSAFLLLFVDACLEVGQFDRGLSAADEAIQFGRKTGETWLDAEAYRLKGECLARMAQQSKSEDLLQNEAEEHFQMSRQIAREQGAMTFELRAIASLCHLWTNQGRGKDGIPLLADGIARFREGLDSPELLRAKALISELENG